MSTMKVTVALKEGMKISPINNQEKKYTLIKSNKDKEMYLLFHSEILKFSEIENIDSEYICVDLNSFSDEVKVIETENKNLYLVDSETFCIHTFISNELNEEDEFISLDMRILKMTREEFLLKSDNDYYLKCRDIIANEYDKQKASQKR